MCRRGRQYGQKPEYHKHGDEKRDKFFHSETVLRIFLSARQSIGHMSILALRILNVNRYINHLYCISAKHDSERETEQKGWPETTKSVKTSQKMYIVAELLTMGRKSVLICLEFSNA